MSAQVEIAQVLERLQNNLRVAGIHLSAADFQGLQDKNFLDSVVAFEQQAAASPNDILPDYLKDWNVAAAVDQTPTPTAVAEKATKSVAGVSKPTSLEALRYTALTEVAELLRTRQLSPVELTEHTLVRLAERDAVLNAFQTVTIERALTAARQAEHEIMHGNYRGPLHGVPVAVKDLLAMAGTYTTAGSKILADWLTDFDATAVSKLHRAGAVIVGKTRMSEFAYSPGSNNAHYGPTRNPWNLEHDTGGSSSGSGAAVADGLVWGAIGTDTGGSIRIPAAQCGLVGLKPTHGRTSLHGGVMLSWSCDHLGPITRTVRDAAVMLEVLAGYDPPDIRTRPNSDFVTPPDLEAGVKGLRIGVVRNGGYDDSGTPEVFEAWHKGLAVLEQAGAELIELDLPQMAQARNINGTILSLEAIAFHDRYLRERLADYGEFMRQRVVAGYAYGPHIFSQAQQMRTALRQHFNQLMERVDIITTPTMTATAPKLGVWATTTYTAPFNLLGWPAITVPVGLGAGNLPLGLQMAARPWHESVILRAAHTIEAAQIFTRP